MASGSVRLLVDAGFAVAALLVGRRDRVGDRRGVSLARRAGRVVPLGEFAINGFRNRDLRALRFPPTDDAKEIRRQSGNVGRLLRLFRDHGLIYRVKETHRYQLSAEGRRILPAFLAARNANTTKLQELAV